MMMLVGFFSVFFGLFFIASVGGPPPSK